MAEESSSIQLNEEPESDAENNHLQDVGGSYSNRYTTLKTVAESVLDVSLLMANVSQLKLVVNRGPADKFYITHLVLIPVVILMQIVTGIMLVVLAFTKAVDARTKEKTRKLNIVTVCLIFVTGFFSTIISTTGLSE